MKNLVTLCTVVVLCTGHAFSADKDEGKKVPPGLEKKGGVPPGQAKKKGQGEDATPAAAPAVANTPATPAAPEPTTLKVDPKTTAAKPATLAEQKAALDKHTQTINQEVKANPSAQKVVFQQISKETGMSVEQLEQQHKNHPNTGANALLLGNLIAKQSGAKFGDVLRAHEGGKHWAEIAKAHNVDIDPLIQKSSHVAQALRSPAR